MKPGIALERKHFNFLRIYTIRMIWKYFHVIFRESRGIALIKNIKLVLLIHCICGHGSLRRSKHGGYPIGYPHFIEEKSTSCVLNLNPVLLIILEY